MRKDWSDELERVNFRCLVCRHTWDAKPDLVEPDDEPEAAHHQLVQVLDQGVAG